MTEFGLPINLEDGLLLRWGRPEDAEALAKFNVAMHSDEPETDPETWLGDWTRDLMRGNHPTTSASDFTIVEDTNSGEIVSSVCLISQRWTYDGIAFGVGRPELVATHPDYRRRGLVRRQMDAVHAKSAARAELVQGITGIPWYYRMFGYEMGLDLGGGRVYPLPQNAPKAKKEEDEKPPTYAIREATLADLPLLQQLYARHCVGSKVAVVRDEAIWRYGMTEAHEDTENRRYHHIVTHVASDTAVGYVEYYRYRQNFNLREIAVVPGHSLRAVALFVLAHLKAQAQTLSADAESGRKLERVVFRLGAAHPVYDALERELRLPYNPYAWYVRVADLPAFLRHIAPALEKQLADSVMAGHSGTVRLNFYTSQMTLVFTDGKLTDVGTYQPKSVEDGDAQFPDLTFLQLLFGYRSFDELDKARADCYSNNETAVLLKILFPQQHSWLAEIG